MQIEIERIAELAKLELEPEKKERFCQQMQEIIGMVENLPELDGRFVGLDAAHPMRLREDQVTPSVNRAELLANAPKVQAGCVVVPRIVE